MDGYEQQLERADSGPVGAIGLWSPGKIMYIGGSDTLPTPLSREEEGELMERLQQGDQRARQTLIEHNLRLVAHIMNNG